jgi:hypothetical protein
MAVEIVLLVCTAKAFPGFSGPGCLSWVVRFLHAQVQLIVAPPQYGTDFGTCFCYRFALSAVTY